MTDAEYENLEAFAQRMGKTPTEAAKWIATSILTTLDPALHDVVDRSDPLAPVNKTWTASRATDRAVYRIAQEVLPLMEFFMDAVLRTEESRRIRRVRMTKVQELQPLGRIIAAELRAKLHPGAELAFGSIAAADITGRARAWRTS